MADDLTSAMVHRLTPIPRESIVYTVAQQILNQLTTGDVAPGTRLPSERELAASLRVGRSAVRGALAALDLLGIVTIRPGSGTYVLGQTSELLPQVLNWGLLLGQPRLQELVELRQHLEPLSARLAAGRADEDDVHSLGLVIDAMGDATDDLARFAELDVEFHLQVARAAKNSALSDVLESIRAFLLVWVERTNNDPEDRLAEHKRIFAAIRSHDEELAEQAMRDHMAIASERLRRSIAE